MAGRSRAAPARWRRRAVRRRPRQSIGAMSCLRLGGGLDGLQASVQFGESLRCTDIGPQAAVMLGTDVSVARCGPQHRYQRKSAVRLSVEQTWVDDRNTADRSEERRVGKG